MKLVPIDYTPTPEDFTSWIVWQEGGLLVVNKPAGVLSQGADNANGQDLVSLARRAFNVAQVAVLHRLDRNVSGLVMLALTAQSARVMSKAFAEGRVMRQYCAVVRGAPPQNSFVVDAPLIKDARTNQVRVARANEPGAKEARSEGTLRQSVRTTTGVLSEIDIRPITGRSHQLRVHLAHVGLPILGDPKYGVAVQGVMRPLLHATDLKFVDPIRGEQVTVVAPTPWNANEIQAFRTKVKLAALTDRRSSRKRSPS